MINAPFRAVQPEKSVVNFNKNLESSGKYRDSFYSEGNVDALAQEAIIHRSNYPSIRLIVPLPHLQIKIGTTMTSLLLQKSALKKGIEKIY